MIKTIKSKYLENALLISAFVIADSGFTSSRRTSSSHFSGEPSEGEAPALS